MNNKYFVCGAKKYISAILIALIFGFSIECIILLSLPPKYKSEFGNDALNFQSTLEIVPVGYEVHSNHYKPLNNDPQLYLSNFSVNLYAIRIEFNNFLQDTIFIQVFYLDKNNLLSEQNSVKQVAIQGAQNVIIELPPNHYDFLRIDINGEFSLKNITYTDQPLAKEKVPDHIYWKQLILINLILIASAIRVAKYKKIKRARLELKSFWGQPRVILSVLFIGYLVCLSMILERIVFGLICSMSFHFSQYWLIFILLFIPLSFYRFRKQIGKHVETGFLIVSISLGVLLVTTIPSGPLISWDDGIHFENTIEVAGFGLKRMTAADDTVIARTFQLDFTPEVIDNQNARLEQEFSAGTIRETLNNFHYNQLGYLPSALGIFLGRVFHFPYHIIFMMGKLSNLFVYVMLAYFSIKKLKSGKVILSIVALFPTTLFLASNYSYDPWVTGWFMFGVSSFISELQQPNKLLNWKTIFGMIIPFLLGCGPKAVYAPFMLVLLIMPKYKFTSDKQKQYFRICVLFGITFAVLSFLAPFVFQMSSGVFVGDIRGGSDVDSKEQMMFILKNPIAYAIILLKFLIQEYLTIEASSMYMTSFAYLGMTGKHALLVSALAIAIFTDKNKHDEVVISGKFRICILFSFFVTTCAVASALYVSFTPVGHPTVNGCQLRYLLPILFPVYFVIGSPHIQNHINKNLYNTVLLLVPAYITISAILSLAYSDIKSYMIVGMSFVSLSLLLYALITKRNHI